jgi:branched-chain amino acid transport system substrate-binding protein
MMQEMDTITALPVAEIKNDYDIFKAGAAVPEPNENLEVIAATPEENTCKMT